MAFITTNKNKIIITIIVSLYALPIIGDVILKGWPRVFNYFAADAFFYTTVARNFSKLGFFTFDGIYPTNGFHPMWQVILGGAYKIFNLFNFSDPVILVGILLLCILIICLALIFLSLGLKNYYGSVPQSALLLSLGIYPILMAFWETRFGSLWSFTNGMETPLVIFSFSLLFLFLSQGNRFLNSPKHMVIFGILNGLLTLSRLDHGLLTVAFLGIFFIYEIRSKQTEKIKYLLISAGTWAGIIAIYLITNKITAGLWLPISGSLKSTFPNPTPFLTKVNELVSLFQRYHEIDFGWWIWRYFQILIPTIFAIPVTLIYFTKILKNQTEQIDLMFASLATFVVSLGFYNFAFVPIFDQGHWYFPISIIFTTLVTIHIIQKINWSNNVWVISSLSIVLVLVFFTQIYWSGTHNELHRKFYLNASEIKNQFNDSEIKMVEYDDGIITYSTGFTALSGFGFCLDNQAATALESGKLLDLAYKRGYRYITSLYYFGDRFDFSTPPEVIKDYFYGRRDMIGQNDLSAYSFEVVYKSTDGKYVLIMMTKDHQ